MADNVAITPGAGATIATDDVGGAQYQRVKVDGGGDGLAAPILGDSANGLDVDVTRVQGTVTVGDGGGSVSVDDNGGSLTVDGTVAISGSVPVTDNAGSLTVDSAQLPAALVGGRLDVNIGAAAAVPVTDNAGSLTVDDGGGSITVDDGAGSLTVDGTVTANQGTPAAAANAWPVKVSDGTDIVGISTVGGGKALKVDVVQAVASSAQTDKSAFVEGTTKFEVVGGVFNETISSDPSEDQAAAARITPKRAIHVNIRKNDGTELGIAATPLRTDPTGTTTQPVLDTNSAAQLTALQLIDDPVATLGAASPAKGMLAAGHDGTNARAISTQTNGHVNIHDGGNSITVDGTVAATQSGAWTADITKFGGSNVVAAAAGIPKVGAVDEAGVAFSETNPLPVRHTYPEQTVWKTAFSYTASQTDITIFTPTGGKRFVVCGIIITPTAAGALLKIYDNTNAAGNMIYQGQPPLGSIVIAFPTPMPSAAVNNVLRYSTGATATGDVTCWGYEV